MVPWSLSLGSISSQVACKLSLPSMASVGKRPTASPLSMVSKIHSGEPAVACTSLPEASQSPDWQ